MLIDWRAGQIAAIHDYRFAPYVTEAVELKPLD